MLETPPGTARLLRGYIIRAASPWPWTPSLTAFVTVVALLVPLLFWLFRRISMQHGSDAPFPFLQLPPELRDMVYMNLLEDPYYPPPPACAKHTGSPLNWMLPRQWPPRLPGGQPSTAKQSNWIFLASKQIYAEYMEMVCKKTTFHLTVSPHNYAPPVEPTAETPRIWTISPSTLKNLRKCDIKLVTTSNMLGVSDPRNMKPDDWTLARQMRSELRDVENVRELNLHVKAIGDPLWNPLWIWYHASQSLKTMGAAAPAAADDAPKGPRLNRITFALDTWSPGENYLERDPRNGGQWAWWCMKGHCVCPDGRTDMPVREFCARLYEQCRVCRPELDSDDESDDA